MSKADGVNGLLGVLFGGMMPRRKVLEGLRRQWGKPGEKREPFADRWFKLTREGKNVVDDKTWEDLEFPRVIRDLDTTVSPVGSQVLHGQLRQYMESADALRERHTIHLQLHDSADLRERIQLTLQPLRDPQYAHIADALFAERPDTPGKRACLTLWGAFCLATLICVTSSVLPIWFMAALVAVNVVLVYQHSWRTSRQTEMLSGCLTMLSVADKLSRIGPSNALISELQTEKMSRSAVKRGLWLLLAYQWNPPWLALIFNFTFLLELILHVWSVNRFYRIRNHLHRTFELVGALDAATAMASALAMYPTHCEPELSSERRLEMVAGKHPLLRDGIDNSITLGPRSALVMGSNMAGKTTFVKMVALNVIFGRTMGFCLAARAVVPCVPVMASIHGSHSVESGKSHYFAEVEAIRGFVEWKIHSDGGLFVLDEPFNGTNTQERIAIAYAVLRALGERSLVLVTTHDVELQGLLNEHYDLYHFQESPDIDGFFDYRLRLGAAIERNAIKLLSRMGFPAGVVDLALATAEGGQKGSVPALRKPTTRCRMCPPSSAG